MRRSRRGFTIVEVSLFLAITGLLFVGLIAGVQGSMFQQRYNDAVQNFAEFLRTAYSETMNVESIGGGRSNKAIYGKLLVFGENYDLEGNRIGADSGEVGSVFSYTVIGNVGEISASDTLQTLKALEINVVDDEGMLIGIPDQYVPRWGSRLQTTGGWNGFRYEDFNGMVLIVRHPKSGTVFTFYNEDIININEGINDGRDGEWFRTALSSGLDGFSPRQIDVCVNPRGELQSDIRRDVRIVMDARNASGVQVVDADDEDSEKGNLCQ